MFKSLVGLSLFCASALAQTPAHSWPTTHKHLGVSYGDLNVTPNLWISSQDVSSQPVVYDTNHNSDCISYMIFMIDWMIPASDMASPDQYPSLVPGLAVNTTNRLHWWGGNFTLNRKGVFVSESEAVSPYTGPRPRDSTNHTYAFYLFEQPRHYKLPAAAADGLYYDQTTNARFNFSMVPIVKAAGNPVAATYFLSNNA
ncbi:uncharacterized protein N7479_000121 [Penicillium vulpinum]|uniref:Phosphatidylethanolamine-binding protein n=1 Tax=Penicillium vulpinum TaxID=29845 RepID=A0A1V6RX34_9EURO|nr:uncharacterized protein N7479_000121 [Penicillium vulpinum]KAJ5970203.1 hypothetical protein N7479_000121 [Penicillium vulpinum]OQE06206.1 hypothetical protein PENVUL_c019G03861 [Penicillium vulpinum]